MLTSNKMIITISDLYDQVKFEKIIINKQNLWDIDKKRSFINNILSNFLINPFVFNIYYDKFSNEEKKICLDGKQRILTIAEFIDNKFTVDEKIFLSLNLEERKTILYTNVFVINYYDYDVEKQLFIRDKINEIYSVSLLNKNPFEMDNPFDNPFDNDFEEKQIMDINATKSSWNKILNPFIRKFVIKGKSDIFISRLMFMCNIDIKYPSTRKVEKYIGTLPESELYDNDIDVVYKILIQINDFINDERFPKLNYFQISTLISRLTKMKSINFNNLLKLGNRIKIYKTNTVDNVQIIIKFIELCV